MVRAFIIDNSGATIAISNESTKTRADKIRVKSFLGKFICATLDRQSMVLSVFSINADSSAFQFYLVTKFSQVRDFDMVLSSAKQTLYLYYTSFESDLMKAAHIQMDQK